MKRGSVAIICVLVVSALAPGIAAPRAGGIAPITTSLSGTVDARPVVAPLPSAQRAASSLRGAVADLSVTWNERMGTAKYVFSERGYLTAPSSRPAVEIARAWLDSHRRVFGLSSDAVASLAVTRDGGMPGGLHPLVFRVMYGSIPTFSGGTLGVNVTGEGRILSVWADAGPSGSLNPRPSVSAADALRAVARREGVSITVALVGQRLTGDRLTIFEPGGGWVRHNARLVAFPTARGPVLAWRVFFAKGPQDLLVTAVDARSGLVLFRHNQIAHEAGDKGFVYRNYPGAARGGKQQVVSFEGDKVASPNGWVAQAPTTLGNNVIAFTDWDWPTLAPGGVASVLAQFNPVPDSMPVSADRAFHFDFANNYGSNGCGAPIDGQVTTVQNPRYALDRDPSVTNVFYFANTMHDFAYKFGFTEKMGNMQTDNLGRGGKAMDATRVMAMAGVMNNQFDNAFMFTPPDGGEPQDLVDPADPASVTSTLPPFTGMFLWQKFDDFDAPCVDGDQDASTAYHEYSHGITSRLTGGPDDSDSLAAVQSASMSEGWSDWMAAILLDSQGLAARPVQSAYVSGNKTTGIRNYPLDDNPLSLGDFGYGNLGPEVHDDGEIWSGTLWQMRDEFVKRYGRARGLARITQIVFDGLATQPRLPSFIDARNAIVKAAGMRNGGADSDIVRRVFALRGIGGGASTRGPNDVHPRPGYVDDTFAGGGNGHIRGIITDADGGALRARVYLGLAEGAPSLVTTSDSDGHYEIRATPGIYRVSAGAPGYGIQKVGRVRVVVDECELCPSPRKASAPPNPPFNFALSKNLASAGWGAKLVGGTEGMALLDDHEFSGQLVYVGVPVVIRLGGSSPSVVRMVSVSPRPQGGFVTQTPRYLQMDLSLDGKTWTKVLTGGAKPYRPRVGPTQWRREAKSIRKKGFKARFVRLTVQETVGRTQTALVGDLMVLGSAPGARPVSVASQKPFTAHGEIMVANPAGAAGRSATEAEFVTKCAVPTSQGLDAYAIAFPPAIGDGLHVFSMKDGPTQGRDIDVHFWNDNCTAMTGSLSTLAADETGPIPQGTRWVVLILYAGTTDGIDIKAVSTLEQVVPPKGG